MFGIPHAKRVYNQPTVYGDYEKADNQPVYGASILQDGTDGTDGTDGAARTAQLTIRWPRVFVPEGYGRVRCGPPDRGRRGQRVLRGQWVSRWISA